MAKGGFLGGTIIGVAIGVGSGRGIALIFVISALFLWLSSIIAFATPRIRNLELEIPDAIPNRPSEVQPEIDGVSIKEMVPVQGS